MPERHIPGVPFSSESVASQYLTPAIVHFLNSILFIVSVPVLSLKIIYTCPSSSVKSEFLQFAYAMVSTRSYILMS